MTQALQFAILGLTSGAVYALFAFGIVITNRASGVVNFAATTIGMVGTFVFWDVNQEHHVAFVWAALAGVGSAAGLGAVMQLLVMRPLRHAAPVTRMVATLGVLTILEQAASHIWTTQTILVPSELPTTAVDIFGAYVGEDKLLVLGIATALALGLGAVCRYSNFGRATLASAENPRAISALGYSSNALALGNWIIGGTLGGIAGILIAPIAQLQIDQYTLFVLPALVAAVVGRLSSLPWTFVGALAIGIMQSEMARYVTQAGWSDAAPFLLLAVVLVIRGGDRGYRTRVTERLPSVGSGVVRMKVILPVIVVAGLITEFLQPTWSSAVTTTVLGAVILLSVVVVTGYSGQLSLAQFSFAGWGAWTASRLASGFHLPLVLSLLVGVLLTVPLGFVVGAICLRTRGVYLAIASLGLAAALEDLIFSNASLTGSSFGITVPANRVFGLDVNTVTHPNRYAILSLLVFALCALAVANMRRGRTGRRMLAVRDNDRAAASLGIGTVATRLYAFVIGSAIAAIGGILLAFENQNVIFTTYSPLQSIQVVSEAVVGGVGWVVGSANGAMLQTGSITGVLLNELGTTWASYLAGIGGLLVVVTVIAAPNGLAAQQWDQIGHVRVWLRRPRVASVPAPVPIVSPTRVDPVTLDISNLTVRFGSTVALSDVSIRVEPGTVVGLIGPNGAGKTTLIDAVTGYVRGRGGRISVGSRDITRFTPSVVARSGVTRSFQSLELFEDMTVLDNIRVASEPQDTLSYLLDLVWPRATGLTSAALAAIQDFKLEPELSKKPKEIPYGTRRLVGIARAVATGASVLLLDEPAAGLSDGETAELGLLVRALAEKWGVGVLLIEHHVDMIMAVCDDVYVLNFGEIIAHGPAEQVRTDPAVIEAYLGVSNPTPESLGAQP